MLQRIKVNRKFTISSLTAAAVLIVVAFGFIEFSWQGHLEGIYLLKGRTGKSLQITDDVFLGEEDALIAGVNFERLYAFLKRDGKTSLPHLELEWSEKDGEGYIRNYLGGEKLLMTSFSRYRDEEGHYTHGLFIGGALPEALLDANENNSGMSYFDGQYWSHIWCNTNEGIGSTVSPHRYPPSSWQFLGSRIVKESPEEVILTSQHEVDVDGVPLQMERTIAVSAGDPEVKLTVRIFNPTNSASRYYYFYGDEPWLGDFGNAKGDVGWVDGQLVEYEKVIDPKLFSSAGMADYGSSVLGEGHGFGHAANFIAWSGPDKPDIVFFANSYQGFNHDPKVLVPLSGDARSIGMYWGPRKLEPGQDQTFSLDIGMAVEDAATGLPKRPVFVPVAHTLPAATTAARKSG